MKHLTKTFISVPCTFKAYNEQLLHLPAESKMTSLEKTHTVINKLKSSDDIDLQLQIGGLLDREWKDPNGYSGEAMEINLHLCYQSTIIGMSLEYTNMDRMPKMAQCQGKAQTVVNNFVKIEW